MKKAKSTLYLITDKKVVKKYDLLSIKLVDGTIVEYRLDEYEASMIDHDWIEIAKLDSTVMDWYAMHNVLSMRFTSSKAKVVPKEIVGLTPVA